MSFVVLAIIFIGFGVITFFLSWAVSAHRIAKQFTLNDAPAIAKRLRAQNFGFIVLFFVTLVLLALVAMFVDPVYYGVIAFIDLFALPLNVETQGMLFWLVLVSIFLGLSAGIVVGSAVPCWRTVRARTLGVGSLIPLVGGK